MSSTAALVATGLTAVALLAIDSRSPTAESRAQAGTHRQVIGDWEVIAVSDVSLPLALDTLLTGTVPGGLQAVIERTYGSGPVVTSITAFLIKTPSRLILVDSGAGDVLGPKRGGQLLTSLRTAGYEPGEIDAVLLTHLHGDHAGGLLAAGRVVFPNATIYLDQDEERFWRKEAEAGTVRDKRVSAERMMALIRPYATGGKVRTFDGDVELFPGIAAIAAHGHTPGHTLYSVESKSQKIVFWGDLIHAAAVQFPYPAVAITFDTDSTSAVAQRARVMADAAKGSYWVAAPHIPFPGIGHVEVRGAGYAWIKAD